MKLNNKQQAHRRMGPKLFCVESVKTNKTTTEIQKLIIKVAKLFECTFGATRINSNYESKETKKKKTAKREREEKGAWFGHGRRGRRRKKKEEEGKERKVKERKGRRKKGRNKGVSCVSGKFGQFL